MFIRINKTPNSPRKSVQIVESVRNGSKVKQKILRYVGVAMNDFEEQKLCALANEYMAQIIIDRKAELKQISLFPQSKKEILLNLQTKNLSNKKNKLGRPVKKRIEDILQTSQVSLDDITERKRVIEGVHEVIGKLFDEFYGSLFKEKTATKYLRNVVLSRMVYPKSKHRLQQILDKQFDINIPLDNIYYMMDKLFPRLSEMKQLTFNRTKNLFPEKMDFVFFDVTTLYFESINIDELRKFGYSKDHRFNTTQVVLALATNQDGLPIGYELFEGNKAEVSTLIASIKSWEKSFEIGKVCFVGDRAMMSQANLQTLENSGYDFIVAAKLKKLPKNIHKKIFDENSYRTTILNNDLAWITEFDHDNQRFVVSYKTKRALNDQLERNQILEKLSKNIHKKDSADSIKKEKKTSIKKLITNNGVKQFVSINDNKSAFIDEDKITAAAVWDGFHGVVTNIKKDSAETIISRYAKLWKIEECFRLNKHNLRMRPIFHFKPERIHAHIGICYMSFALLRHLEYRVNLTQQLKEKLSVNVILDELLNVQSSIYEHKITKDLYRIPGNFSNQANKIYKAMSVKRSLDAEIFIGTAAG